MINGETKTGVPPFFRRQNRHRGDHFQKETAIELRRNCWELHDKLMHSRK